MAGETCWKLEVDLKKCVGHGRCYDVAPKLFAPDDDEGRAKVLVSEVPDSELERAQLAVQSCPEDAITLRKA